MNRKWGLLLCLLHFAIFHKAKTMLIFSLLCKPVPFPLLFLLSLLSLGPLTRLLKLWWGFYHRAQNPNKPRYVMPFLWYQGFWKIFRDQLWFINQARFVLFVELMIRGDGIPKSSVANSIPHGGSIETVHMKNILIIFAISLVLPCLNFVNNFTCIFTNKCTCTNRVPWP